MNRTTQSNTRESKAPAVSIVVPVYNTASYLEDCIASVVNQTFTDFELILINDASTDNSKELCESASREDPRIRFISSPEHKGVSQTRNKGIDVSVGKYIFFLDSDDMLHPEMLELLYLEAKKTNSDLCATGFISSDQCEEKNWKALCARHLSPNWNTLFGDETLEHWFHLSFFNQTWGKLFLKESINDLRFDENEKLAEDTLFNYHFITENPRRISYTDSYGYYYKIREGSANHTISYEGLIASLNIKRRISDEELSCDRKENAVIMEAEYERQIRRYIHSAQNKRRREEARELLIKEKKKPLYKEISFYEKSMVFLILYFRPLYIVFYKVSRTYLKFRYRKISVL